MIISALLNFIDCIFWAWIRSQAASVVIPRFFIRRNIWASCEASLLFLPPDIAKYRDLWKTVGYDTRTIKDLGVRAWQDAAVDSMKPGTVMFFKQLRKDRVLRPV